MAKAWHHSSQNISVLFSQARRESDTFPARGRQEFLPSLDATLLREVGRSGEFKFMSWIGLNHERAIRFSEYNPEAGFVAMAIVPSIFLKRLTSPWSIMSSTTRPFLQHESQPKIIMKWPLMQLGWTLAFQFKPFSRSPVHVYVGKLFPRKNNVFLSKYPATFPPRNPCYWSNRQFEETRQTSTTAAILAVGFGTWGEHIRFQALSFFQ